VETDVKYILEASEKLGYGVDGLLRDAVNLFLTANKEFREKIAIELYKDDRISLGKASEIACLSYEDMKGLLRENRISIRRGPESAEKLKEKAEKLLSML